MMAVLTKASERRLNAAMRRHGGEPKTTVFYRRGGDLMFPKMEVCDSEDMGASKIG